MTEYFDGFLLGLLVGMMFLPIYKIIEHYEQRGTGK